MSDFLADLSVLHDENMALFGQDVVHTSALGTATTIRASLQTGIRLESSVAGDGTYARLSFPVSTITPLPEPGEKITIGVNVYLIREREVTATNRVLLLLRMHQRG